MIYATKNTFLVADKAVVVVKTTGAVADDEEEEGEEETAEGDAPAAPAEPAAE